LFVGTGASITKVTDVNYGATAPSDQSKLWIDTTNNVIKRYDGTSWIILETPAAAATFTDLQGLPSDNAALLAALNLKANVSSLSNYATTSALTTGLAAKADSADVTTALALKADITSLSAYATNAALTSGLATKADDAATTTALGTKADAAATTASLAAKANSADVTTALALKADQATTYTIIATDAKFALKADNSSLSSYALAADVYTKLEVDTTITNLINAAPAALDTLGEIAAQLALDESVAAGIITTLATKAASADVTAALALKADASSIVTYTASAGVQKVGSDFSLAASVAGTGLDLTAGVLSIVTVDGGTF
jgi:hypothetical protein